MAGPFHKERAISSHPTKIPGSSIERPARYTLVIDLKTAKALGLTILATLIVQADAVIQYAMAPAGARLDRRRMKRALRV